MSKDIRVYCGKCAQDVRDAGYILMRTGKQTKEECDKCDRMGFEFNMQNKKALVARLNELDARG